MLPRLDHIAIAVEDLGRAQKFYEDLGLVFEDEREVVESQGVTTAFAKLSKGADGVRLELLERYGDDGPIHKFLAKRGPGIHHICFAVKDVARASAKLQEMGYQLLHPKPVPGANNCLVNFLHPKSTGGTLIELSTPNNP